MSGALTGLGYAAGIASGIDSLLISNPRQIATLFPSVTLEEEHHDQVVITEHPVETGAPVNDHAYARPSELSMHVGWSNTQGLYENYVQDVYQQLLALKDARQPFSVTTGKRSYDNMLIAELGVSTDNKTEHVLDVHVTFRQINFVDTETTSLPPQQDHALPQETAPVQSAGITQPAPVNSSLLSGIMGWVP